MFKYYSKLKIQLNLTISILNLFDGDYRVVGLIAEPQTLACAKLGVYTT